ncbi:MAG: GGDEF domain-containing protein [Planctomycetes bacterium]|nr:GGDEF domain-containing protein [Planctomycetota bacterium]
MPRSDQSLYGRLVGVGVMLLASVTLTAIVLHVWQMRQAAHNAGRRALGEFVEFGAMQVSQVASRAADPAVATAAALQQFDQWAWAATRADSGPAVLAAALCDQTGRLLRVCPPNTKFAPVLSELTPSGAFCTLRPVEVLGKLRQFLIAAHPLDAELAAPLAGRVVVLAARPRLIAAWGLWLGTFAIPLTGVAVLSFVIGLRWLRSRVAEPLRTLVRRPDESEVDWLARLPTGRADELGGIARRTEEVVTELATAQNQLQQLQSSLDSKVAERTREIHAMLMNAQQQAWIDALTLLGNRRLLDDRLEAVFRDQRTRGGDLTLVMFDIDNFKVHNDTQGHAAGDDLLRFFGCLLRGSLRETDLGIRYAGDEFVVLLPDVPAQDAAKLATRIVRLFGQHTSTLPTRPRVTLSAGVASMRLCGSESGGELLTQADAALYQAKGGGKNGVRIAASTAPPHATAADQAVR